MAETALWDGKVPTRQTFMTRTFSWASTPGTVHLTDQAFIDTTLKGIYKWNGSIMQSVILSEEEAIAEILALI